jgi:hypothetical protein
VVSDGWSGYAKLKDVNHDAKVVASAAAHVLLPRVHRLFANLKRWALGVYHGLRRKHLQFLPRRVRLPLQPALLPENRLPLPPEHRRQNQPGYLEHVDQTGRSGIRISRISDSRKQG